MLPLHGVFNPGLIIKQWLKGGLKKGRDGDGTNKGGERVGKVRERTAVSIVHA